MFCNLECLYIILNVLYSPAFFRNICIDRLTDYVDDSITKRKKNIDIDELFQNMNSHHMNIKLTVETNPTRFLDTAFSKNLDGSVTTKVFHKPGKLSIFWNSQIPKRYKWNNIRGDLHHAFKIASDFDAEVQTITVKYLEVRYPISFIKSVINDFKNSKGRATNYT